MCVYAVKWKTTKRKLKKYEEERHIKFIPKTTKTVFCVCVVGIYFEKQTSHRSINIRREMFVVCVVKANTSILKNIYVVEIHLNSYLLCMYVRSPLLIYIHKIMINDDYDIRKWNLCNNICFCVLLPICLSCTFLIIFPFLSLTALICL